MFVAALEVELRIVGARSLKDKRQAVKPILEGTRRRFGVSAAEVDAQGSWQRAVMGFAVVASAAGIAEEVLDQVERFVWSRPDVEVVRAELHWLG
jgi:uncharacterized protein YlxP (DUF503 family)